MLVRGDTPSLPPTTTVISCHSESPRSVHGSRLRWVVCRVPVVPSGVDYYEVSDVRKVIRYKGQLLQCTRGVDGSEQKRSVPDDSLLHLPRFS